MLVLSRKLNQEIVIGNDIRITVLKVKGNTVRLGIDAPRDVHVIRGELEDAHQPANEYTVVFSNSDEEQSAQVNVVPFNPTNEAESKRALEQIEKAEANPESISFRGRIPESLQRNRLKEIVDNMTTSKESAASKE